MASNVKGAEYRRKTRPSAELGMAHKNVVGNSVCTSGMLVKRYRRSSPEYPPE